MGFFFKRSYTLFELCCDCYDGNKLKEISFDINEKLQGAELVKFVLPQLRLKYEEIEENEDDETEELQEYIDEIEDGDLSNLDYVCHEYEIVAVPLFIAIKQENTNLVKQLLQNGADVNKSFDGIFPIIYAASCGNIDIVKLLIEEGANIDVLDEDQNPPIYWPMLLSGYEDKRKIFEYLLKITDLGKKYKNQKNLLHLAIDNFIPLKTIKAILKENPALINELDSNAFSCLDYAYMKQAYDEEEVKIIKFLLDKGGKTNIINSKLLEKTSNFYNKLKKLYSKYKVDQNFANESLAEIINMHQAMKMENNIPDNIPDCIMQEMIILIMYTRIEDIKSKLGIDVSDNYVPFISAYFPFTEFAYFIHLIAGNINIFDAYYPKTLNLLINLERFLIEQGDESSCRITEEYYEICRDAIEELKNYGSKITEKEITRGRNVLARIQEMRGFNNTVIDDSFVDKELKSKFCDYLKSIDNALSMFEGKELDQNSEERLKMCYDRYNLPVKSLPFSELVQADMQILLMGSRMEGIANNYEQGFQLNDFFIPYFSENSLRMASEFVTSKLGKSKISVNNQTRIDADPNTFNFFIQFGKVIDIINEEKGAEKAGNFFSYYYLVFLSSFANEFMAYGKIPGSDTEVEIAQNTIDGFTKLYNETFVNNKDVPNNSTTVSAVNSENEDVDILLEELNSLIGLEKVKEEVTNLINIIKVRKLREAQGLKQVPLSLHLVFSGNPGTGKTTVARILAKIYKEIGVLSKGQLIETDRSGLVAGYVGQTAIKTSEAIESAKGGILFIDEAHALSNSDSSNDYGQEAIDTILKAMEDIRNDFIVIVAGYPDLMKKFLKSNPGLESRFNTFIDFEDYLPDDLFKIFMGMCEKNNYMIKDDISSKLMIYFNDLYENRTDSYANARTVRNFFENSIKKQANRVAKLSNPSLTDLQTLLSEDLF